MEVRNPSVPSSRASARSFSTMVLPTTPNPWYSASPEAPTPYLSSTPYTAFLST